MFIPSNKGREVGDWVTTHKRHECLAGVMTKGTKVKIIGIGERGYDIEDEFGNKVLEIGWEI